jgi:hypothetical protein
VHLTGRTTGDAEVLAGNVHRATEHGSRAGDHTVGRHDRSVHPEQRRAVLGEHPALFEAQRVDQLGNPLAGGQLAGGVLFGMPLLATSRDDLLAAGSQLSDPLLHRHGPRSGGTLGHSRSQLS